jgi:hypothetical protein
MIHPSTKLQYISDQMGYGVFATQLIPKGTIVYVKDSLEIEIQPLDFLSYPGVLQEQIEKYSYIDEKGVRIISWDLAKYVNHCCQFNTISTGYGFEIAIRDIHPGEEITDEYGLFNMCQEMEIGCCQSGCRGRVSALDADLYWQEWDEKIIDALQYLQLNVQPLLPLVDPYTREHLEAYLSGRAPYESVQKLRHKTNLAS